MHMGMVHNMEIIRINLYEYFNLPKPENSEGNITGWIYRTSSLVSPCRRRPAILVIPGGGYDFNSDREAEPVAFEFLNRGYVPFVLRYSCAPNVFPVQLRESAMAMRYIRENANHFEIDPAMVAAIGFSAGGHLCGTLGTMYDCKEVSDIATADIIRPNALALCYPVTLGWGPTHEGTMRNVSGGSSLLRQRLSLDNQVRSDMPPVFLWHTRDDNVVPCRNSLILAEKLDEAGVDFSLYLYRHGEHGLSLADNRVYGANVPTFSQDATRWITACSAFFQEVGFCFLDEE